MNKNLLIFFAVIFFSVSAHAQSTQQPVVRWEFSTENIQGKNQLVFSGIIADGWKLFSLEMPDSLPNTRVQIQSAHGTIIGHPQEKGESKQEKSALFDNTTIHFFEHSITIIADVNAAGTADTISGAISFMAIRGDSVIGPESAPFKFISDASAHISAVNATLQESSAGEASIIRKNIDIKHPVNEFGGTGAENSSEKSMLHLFVLGLLGGLVGLLMPCTFPMIPLTVSFFTKKAGNKSSAIKHAALYGFFIFLIYVLISVPFYFLGGSSSGILNNIATNVWLNLFFALIFVAFALSFFGLYEIGLPSKFSNAANAKSDFSSLGGIFFMALTLAIVSFSCTGPILGTLLVGALNQARGTIQLTVALAGFGLALGLPFALFAMFPKWLAALPKSGSWMDAVKIVFGFIELALAIKFLSNADLVEHWGILKREIFFGIWVIIGILIVLYLSGRIHFKHEAPVGKLSAARIIFIIFFSAFTIYLIPGITKSKYANIRLISGFPPPLSYSIYGKELVKLNGMEADVVNDYNKALALAREQHKPLMIDFTGWACVNCRKMEENVWTDPAVRKTIQDNFILVSLYVDDRKKLPDDATFLFKSSDGSSKAIQTIGDKYSTFQAENFGNASQPLYALISPDEKLLNLPVGYTPSATAYVKWLQNGLDAFAKSGASTPLAKK